MKLLILIGCLISGFLISLGIRKYLQKKVDEEQ